MVPIRYILFYFLYLCQCYVNSDDRYGRALPEVERINRNLPFFEEKRLDGILYQVEKKYVCHTAQLEINEDLLLYGTKAWTFPPQDVNLTLRYPSENSNEENDYSITGVTIILNMDGADRGGYIISGGLLMDNIAMNFILENTSRLSYQFWLYGVSNRLYNASTFIEYRGLC